MTFMERLEKEPWGIDFLDLMRRIERTLAQPVVEKIDVLRSAANAALELPRPRIGDGVSRIEETISVSGQAVLVSFGQDPWMEFPASNVAGIVWRTAASAAPRLASDVEKFDFAEPNPDRLHILSRALGLLGPQGALPLSITEEVRGWILERDHAFPYFLDIFNNRFIQLFYRAWADSRPVVQNDRPDKDRFQSYIGSVIGIGSNAFASLEALPNGISLFAGLLGAGAKSASRLRNAIRGLFKVEVEIDQLVGSWLKFETSDLSRLGGQNSNLGSDLMIGEAAFSVQDKFRIRIFVKNMEQYERFLPPGKDCRRLFDLVFFYLGDELDWDVELALPAEHVRPTSLGNFGALGWTSWMAPNYKDGSYRCDARFHPAERFRRESNT